MKISRFLAILNIFCFLQKLAELAKFWHGSENWMHNIIFGPIYFAALNKNWDFTHRNILDLGLVYGKCMNWTPYEGGGSLFEVSY